MKECKYCGTKYRDELDICPNCGGNLIVTAEEIAQAAELAQKEKENQNRSVAEPQNHLKKLIGIIAGVVAAIIVIVVGASYVHNHRAVNGDLSRADMAKAYEQGTAFYNSGDYASAIIELGKVSAESKCYVEASAMLQETVTIYCDDALSKASAYANVGDYKMTCSILENALQVVPANSTLTAELTSYQETFRNQLRNSALESVNTYVAENDYPSAIQVLRSTLEELDGDIELDALLKRFEEEYSLSILEKSDEALRVDGYSAAVEILINAMGIMTDDTVLNDAILMLDVYKPVSTSEVCTGWLTQAEQTSPTTDIWGNEYTGVNYRLNAAGILFGGSSLEIALNKEYDIFEATLAPGTCYRFESNMQITVYLDDVVFETYDFDYKTYPVDIKIDVSNVDYIKIYKSASASNELIIHDPRVYCVP